MKENIEIVLIRIFKLVMRLCYACIKIFPVKDKITFISRQSDHITLDFNLLNAQLKKEGIHTVVLTKKLQVAPLKLIKYIPHMFVQMYHVATSRVVIVDSYCIVVSILKHKKNLKIVQIWHALSAIKQFGYQTIDREDGTLRVLAREMHMHKNYDYVLASSDITADHFCRAFNIKLTKIVKLGLPRIDYILGNEKRISKDINKVYPQLSNGKKNLLYAPTFRKKKKVDVAGLIKNIDFEKYNLIVKLHPLDEFTICSTFKETENVIFDKIFNSYDLLKLADIIIADYSSFVVEASLVNKPIFLYVYDINEYKKTTGINIDFTKQRLREYTFTDAKELSEALDKEYELSVVEEFKNKFIDVDTVGCTRQIVDFLKNLMESETK